MAGRRSKPGGARSSALWRRKLPRAMPSSVRASRLWRVARAACSRYAESSRCATVSSRASTMNERSMISDDAERAAALDVLRSFVVQAPAGSGKTELLMQRYLALVARVERPEAIVAMTFTRKAAGEIRERIITALREAVAAPGLEPNRERTLRLARAVLQRDATLGWQLAAQPARLQVHTIDALCMALTRQAPLTAKLGA